MAEMTADQAAAFSVFEDASQLVLAPGATDDDVRHAFKMVDALDEPALSELIRRTASDWGVGEGAEENPLAKVGQAADPADAVAYDYEDEDSED